MLYELKIKTGFILPSGEQDAIILYFDNFDDCVKYAKESVEQTYTVEISLDEEVPEN